PHCVQFNSRWRGKPLSEAFQQRRQRRTVAQIRLKKGSLRLVQGWTVHPLSKFRSQDSVGFVGAAHVWRSQAFSVSANGVQRESGANVSRRSLGSLFIGCVGIADHLC